jgi:ribosome-binding factor A
MTSKKQWLKNATALCAEIRPEDGIDPRKVIHKSNRSNKHRKTYQVCKQAERTLNLVLAGESVEALLRELSVCAVEPNPDSSRLLVIVEPISTTVSLDKCDVLKALQRAEGRLRSAIATTINRKRVPQLTFQFLSPMEVPW